MKLTSEQIQELKWFSKNVAGTRREFYDVVAQVNKFKKKIDRLDKTKKIIKDFMEKNSND